MSGCDALDAAGVARIEGLSNFVKTFPVASATVAAASASGTCPLSGNVWGEGNILLGGGGGDTIEGRGGDDIIDGDQALHVRIAVLDAGGTEIGSTDLMEGKALTGTFGPGTAGMTLQQAVFAGLVDPGRLAMRRKIEREPTPTGTIDTAVFSGPQSNYTITRNADGSVTVSDGGGAGPDGTDTLTGIETLRFGGITGTDVAIAAAAPPAPPAGPGAGPNPPAAPLAAAAAQPAPTAPIAAAAPVAPAVTPLGSATAPRPAPAALMVRSLQVTSTSSARIAVAASVPAGANTVAITLLRLDSAANRKPGAKRLRRSVRIATVYRTTTTAKRYVFRLTEKPFRNLKPGRYLVQIRVGASRTALGPATSRQVTVTRSRSKPAR
jgi:Ca2+-binding RTX toxin-like protein